MSELSGAVLSCYCGVFQRNGSPNHLICPKVVKRDLFQCKEVPCWKNDLGSS